MSLETLWDLRDTRVDDWPLMSSCIPTIVISLAYVFIVKVAGPRFMENREPYNIRTFLILYNAVQVLASVYVGVKGLMVWKDYKLICQEVDYSEDGLSAAHAAYYYFIMKFTEFIDTFAFVARKKNEQVSTLHVIHHSILPLTSWLGVRWAPGGHGSFGPLLNTFVHVIMYTYYMIAVMGPEYKRFIWWKKYLTGLQMVQFVMIVLHTLPLFVVEDCGFPSIYGYMLVPEVVMFLFMFSNFYTKSYTSKKHVNGCVNGALKNQVETKATVHNLVKKYDSNDKKLS